MSDYYIDLVYSIEEPKKSEIFNKLTPMSVNDWCINDVSGGFGCCGHRMIIDIFDNWFPIVKDISFNCLKNN